ncbi:unnamed protein product, partial [Chrysoparadoxa australica]
QALSGLAEKIVQLRTEVETLNTENNARKAELQSELKSLQSRKAQVSAQMQQIELSLKQGQERLKTIKEELSKATIDGDTLVPLLKKEVVQVKSWVQGSLPFQKEKRLKEVNDIQEGLETGVLTGQKALGKLWAFIEDELRLGRENGVHRQTLVIDGEENLVSVAKLGMVAMFYKTSDNRYGFTKRNKSGSFDFIPLKQKESVEQVAMLFDGLKKQIRTGQYTIPNVFN